MYDYLVLNKLRNTEKKGNHDYGLIAYSLEIDSNDKGGVLILYYDYSCWDSNTELF
jgi:hypothetical protein